MEGMSAVDRERDGLSIDQFAWNADGLIPVIAQQHDTGEVLMLAWMDREALRRTLADGRAWYWSRSRASYWMKGETSGAVQDVVDVRYDCDADSLLLLVDQQGSGACHTGERTCFYRRIEAVPPGAAQEVTSPMSDTTPTIPPTQLSLGTVIEELYALLEQRLREQPEGSYTVKLLTGPQDKLLKKIAEEAGEVIIAARDGDHDQTRYEIADLLYHLLVVMVREGVEPADLAAELAGRRK
jgi:phosphoribosyl-ATP pyrophosphohydrolase/phosphoribosyl-AMP cyclohydrolase